jgi:hypothetical protein
VRLGIGTRTSELSWVSNLWPKPEPQFNVCSKIRSFIRTIIVDFVE